MCPKHGFEFRFGPAGRSCIRTTCRVKEKKTQYDLVRPDQKPYYNMLAFIFVLKKYHFDLKKLTQTTRSKSEIHILDRTNHWTWFKKYGPKVYYLKIGKKLFFKVFF
jgi:hypothetical protein